VEEVVVDLVQKTDMLALAVEALAAYSLEVLRYLLV
jgi:hypothetical protein